MFYDLLPGDLNKVFKDCNAKYVITTPDLVPKIANAKRDMEGIKVGSHKTSNTIHRLEFAIQGFVVCMLSLQTVSTQIKPNRRFVTKISAEDKNHDKNSMQRFNSSYCPYRQTCAQEVTFVVYFNYVYHMTSHARSLFIAKSVQSFNLQRYFF